MQKASQFCTKTHTQQLCGNSINAIEYGANTLLHHIYEAAQ